MRAGSRTRYMAAAGILALAVVTVASAEPSPSHRFRTAGAPAFPVAYRGFLWVAAHRGGAIYKIDPRRNRVIHAYQTSQSACFIEGSGDRIVYNTCDGPSVTVLNIRTGRVRTIRGIPHFPVLHRRAGVAYWDGNFRYAGSEWTIAPEPVTVVRRDPTTHVVLKRWRGIDDEGTSTIAAGSIWIPGLTEVARIDPRDDSLTLVPLPGARKDPGPDQGYAVVERVAVTPGTVWVTNPAGLYRIDERTNTATRVPGFRIGDFSQFGYIDLIAAKGSLFMRIAQNRVVRIDPANGKIAATYPAGGGGGGIEVAYGSLWVTNFISDTTWRIPLG